MCSTLANCTRGDQQGETLPTHKPTTFYADGNVPGMKLLN